MKFSTLSLFAAAALATTMLACAAGQPTPAPGGGNNQNLNGDNAAGDCAAAKGQCVAVVPGACQGGSTIDGLCGGGVGATCCVQPASKCVALAGQSSGGGVGLGNPASIYCTQMGYVLNGSQCVLSATVQCEEWAFYRGECGAAQSFCARQGGTVKNVTEMQGTAQVSYAKCTLPIGVSCNEQSFAASCQCK
jgi:putative hemolysin